MKQKLIGSGRKRMTIQGDGAKVVMIPRGEVPVLAGQSQGEDPAPLAAMVANFLRCGCPAVEVFWSYFTRSPEAEVELHDAIVHLQLPTEQFRRSTSDRVENEGGLLATYTRDLGD